MPNRAGLSTAVFGFAVALLALPPAAPALAEEPTFFSESKPMFDNCGDGSLGKAQKDGITLGFSQNSAGGLPRRKDQTGQRHRLGHQQGRAGLDGRRQDQAGMDAVGIRRSRRCCPSAPT